MISGSRTPTSIGDRDTTQAETTSAAPRTDTHEHCHAYVPEEDPAASQSADRLRARCDGRTAGARARVRAPAGGRKSGELADQAVRADFPQPAVHAGRAADVLGAGAGRGR